MRIAGTPEDQLRADAARRPMRVFIAARTRFAEDALARLGEPWLTYFEPDEIRAELTALGFADPTDLGPAGLAARFFDRPDVPPDTPGGHVLHAVRPGQARPMKDAAPRI